MVKSRVPPKKDRVAPNRDMDALHRAQALLSRAASASLSDASLELKEALNVLSGMHALLLAQDWRPISTAPKDRGIVDLWIQGPSNEVSFYVESPLRVPKRRDWLQGRAANFRWHQKGPNPANWYPSGGLLGYPLSPEVEATHWRPLPASPGCLGLGDACQLVEFRPMKTVPAELLETAEPLLILSPTTHTYVVVGRFWAQDNTWLADEPGRAQLKPEAWALRPRPFK